MVRGDRLVLLGSRAAVQLGQVTRPDHHDGGESECAADAGLQPFEREGCDKFFEIGFGEIALNTLEFPVLDEQTVLLGGHEREVDSDVCSLRRGCLAGLDCASTLVKAEQFSRESGGGHLDVALHGDQPFLNQVRGSLPEHVLPA